MPPFDSEQPQGPAGSEVGHGEPVLELVREGWFGLAGMALLLAPAVAVYAITRSTGAPATAADAAAGGAFLAWLILLARHAHRNARLRRALAGLLMPLGEPRGL